MKKKINTGRTWSKILYPLLTHIISIKKAEDVSLLTSNITNTISNSLTEQEPESALSTYVKMLMQSQELCEVNIEVIDEEIKSTILKEQNTKYERCSDPMVKKTVKSETPLSATQYISINLTFNRTITSTYNINLHLNILTFLTIYLLRNKDRNNLQIKTNLIASLEKYLENVNDEKKLAEIITRILFEFGHYDDVSYFKLEKNRRKLKLISQFAIIGMNLSVNYEQSIDIGIMGKAIKEKNIVFTNDAGKSDVYYLSDKISI